MATLRPRKPHVSKIWKKSVVGFISLMLALNVYIQSLSDWRSSTDRNHERWFDIVTKQLMFAVCSSPGTRLLCASPTAKKYSIDEVTLLDGLVLNVVYGLCTVFVLWVLTPLPDINVRGMFLMQLEDRSTFDDDDEEHIFPHPPSMRLGGGEGHGF